MKDSVKSFSVPNAHAIMDHDFSDHETIQMPLASHLSAEDKQSTFKDGKDGKLKGKGTRSEAFFTFWGISNSS